MGEEILIRKANREDLPAVLGLVIELAIYEKEPDAVTATIADYNDAFERGLIQVNVAEQKQTIIGMTLSYDYFSTWKGRGLYLEDFYIQEAYRGTGLAQRLFEQYLSDAKECGASLMKWQVLDWNEPAIKFYEKYNATIDKGWWNCRLILK